jgi:hypothetical protein
MTARALAHYTAMAQEAAQLPLRCVVCGGVAFGCRCVTFDACSACRWPNECRSRVVCARSVRMEKALGRWVARKVVPDA